MIPKILSFDPGDHTGWFCRCGEDDYQGGTVLRNHVEVGNLIYTFKPEMVVIESFHMYPQLAKSLAWNSFYPCEVIGVIKYICDKEGIKYYMQSPSVKKYYGSVHSDWETVRANCSGVTEHTKDAYMHYRYFIRSKRLK